MSRRTPVVTFSLLSALLLVSGCGENSPSTSGPSPAASAQIGEEPTPDAFLAEHGLEGMDARQVIEELEGADDPPEGLTATVGSEELVLGDADSDEQVSLPLGRKFYLSVAPYIDKAPKCDERDLIGDRGELVDKQLRVLLIGLDGEIVATNTVNTNARGYVGFWLQRDIDATLQMSYGDRNGNVDIDTYRNSPTCLTTLRLQ